MARRVLHDRFFKQAKAEGYAARSAYKLKEIQQKRTIIRPGDAVLDLGCAPGSWLQVAAEIVGPRGNVVGIDLKAVGVRLPGNARAIVGDAFSTGADELLTLNDGRRYDVVLSDMAPNTTGAGPTDHFRSMDLCRRVLELAAAALRPGGNLVMKALEGEAYPELLRDCGRVFTLAKGIRPKATREISTEIFVVATGFRPPIRPAPEPPA